MKAVHLVKFGEPTEAFEIREVAKPAAGSLEILIKVEAFGLNFADVLARKGLYPSTPSRPCILGYEVVGRVEAQGKDVLGEWIGRRVVGFTRFGGYAEYATTDYRAAGNLAESYPADKALALATQYTTAYYCFHESMNLRSGDRVLIHAAAGGVGIALCQLALNAGCEVFGTAGSDRKIEFLNKLGIHHAINYSKSAYPKVVRAKLKGQKLDATFNSLAGKSVNKDRKLLGAGGRLVLFGAASRVGKWGGFFANLLLLFRTGFLSTLLLIGKSQAIIGVNILQIADHKPELLQECLSAVIKMAEAKKIDPVSNLSFKVAELNKAHLALEKRSTIGKVVIYW